MVEHQRWFRRHPKTAITVVVLGCGLLLDLLLGWLMIPQDNRFRCPHPFYHHGLLPNRDESTVWGKHRIAMITNSLGFRDHTPRQIANQPGKRRLLILGDSFTEGVGVRYQKTFAGLLEQALAPEGIEVLNAAAVSYSPKLYYLKARHMIEVEQLKFDQLAVFIDISDIQNEISYEAFEPAEFSSMNRFRFALKQFGQRRSFVYHTISKLMQPAISSAHAPTKQNADLFPCLVGMDPTTMADPLFQETASLWTIKPEVFGKYGKRGLDLAIENMDKLAALCKKAGIKLTVAVYPWPQQIQHRLLENLQVTAWRDYSKRHGAQFVDLFPKFIDQRSHTSIRAKYFLDGDVHWNEAGHQLVADSVAPLFQ